MRRQTQVAAPREANQPRQRRGHHVRFKPLPVYVQGPLALPPPPKPKGPSSSNAAAPLPGSVAMAVALSAPTVAPTADKAKDDEDDELRILILVAQGLHQAVAKEYGERFHLCARNQFQTDNRAGDELAELAARFQIELTEAPPPSRLQEFWEHAGLTHEGMLFNAGHRRGRQQGLREMVALTGVSHVHQRISGKLEESDKQQSGQNRRTETQIGVDAKWAELVKPLSALTAGSVVGAAGALGGSPGWALVLGVLAALGAGLAFRMTSTVQRHSERKLDRTFMPDLTTKTLHRVMPELFERLLAAGLAPVFIVDELDKVDDLYSRIHKLLDTMKNLFAERAFTCLLVDRGFYEQLHWREERERSGGTPASNVAAGQPNAGGRAS